MAHCSRPEPGQHDGARHVVAPRAASPADSGKIQASQRPEFSRGQSRSMGALWTQAVSTQRFGRATGADGRKPAAARSHPNRQVQPLQPGVRPYGSASSMARCQTRAHDARCVRQPVLSPSDPQSRSRRPARRRELFSADRPRSTVCLRSHAFGFVSQGRAIRRAAGVRAFFPRHLRAGAAMSEYQPGYPAVEVKNLSQSFGDRWAVRNASFTVESGSLHGFVGPNGAGKTTTLKIICTLLEPQAGAIRVFGQDVVLSAREVRRRIGFMPDHFSMYRRMSVFEYLDFFGAAYGLTAVQRDQIIKDVLALTDMRSRQNDLIAGLSRGMQQRVSLARVLVSDPDLLLLDEPASGLDPRARIELMEVLKLLKGMGKTIFISSHILSELAELCDSVTIIDVGRIKFSGSMQDLLRHSHEHSTYRLCVGGEWPELERRLNELKGVVGVERLDGRPEFRISFNWTATDTNALLRSVLDMGVTVVSFAEERRHLNEAFMDLTEGGLD